MKQITVEGFVVLRSDGVIAIHDHEFRAFSLSKESLEPLAAALTEHDLPPEYDV